MVLELPECTANGKEDVGENQGRSPAVEVAQFAILSSVLKDQQAYSGRGELPLQLVEWRKRLSHR